VPSSLLAATIRGFRIVQREGVPTIFLRCTRKLLSRLRSVEDPPSSVPRRGILGDWYAATMVSRRRQLVVGTNARTLLTVVVPLAPASGFIERFQRAARGRIEQVVAWPEKQAAELADLADIRIGRTESRSVVGSMNQMIFEAEGWLESRPAGDLDELGWWLTETPRLALRTSWPIYEVELLMTGGVTHPHIRIRPE